MKKISKKKKAILKKYDGVKVQEKKPFNEARHKLIAKELGLEYSTTYKVYYCLLNRFKLNNDYFNFLYYTFLSSQSNKEEAIKELSSIAWLITKEVTHGVNFNDQNWVRGVYEFAYKFFKEELEQLLGIRKTTTTKTVDKTPKTVYIKIYNNYDFSNYNDAVYDNYTALDKQDKELLIKYLCNVLTRKQYNYLVEVLEGKHSFSSSGKMAKKIKELLATDTLLKYLKGE